MYLERTQSKMQWLSAWSLCCTALATKLIQVIGSAFCKRYIDSSPSCKDKCRQVSELLAKLGALGNLFSGLCCCQGRLPPSLVQELTSQLADLSSNLIHNSKQAQKRMTLLGTLIFMVFNRNQANTGYRQSHNDWGNGEYQHLKRSTR